MRAALTTLLLAVPITFGCVLADGTDDVSVDPMPPIAWLLEPELARFATWLSGSFVTDDRNERLDCARIWAERPGLWLFVERRAPSRVGSLHIEIWWVELRDDSSCRVHVHDLPPPAEEFRGSWRDAALLSAIGPKDLRPRPERALTLLDRSDSFQGGSDALRVVVGEHRVLWQEHDDVTHAAGVALSFGRVQ